MTDQRSGMPEGLRRLIRGRSAQVLCRILLKEIPGYASVKKLSELSLEAAANTAVRMQQGLREALTQSFQEEYHGVWPLATSLLLKFLIRYIRGTP
jgi:hypothetical protein